MFTLYTSNVKAGGNEESYENMVLWKSYQIMVKLITATSIRWLVLNNQRPVFRSRDLSGPITSQQTACPCFCFLTGSSVWRQADWRRSETKKNNFKKITTTFFFLPAQFLTSWMTSLGQKQAAEAEARISPWPIRGEY